jgi:hypothetical protein
MKRSSLIRHQALPRGGPLPKVNPIRQAKRRKRRPRVTAAESRAIRKEAGYQCTFVYSDPAPVFGSGVYDPRCPETEHLEIHHGDYKKGGKRQLLCRYHHHLLESQLRPWNINRLGR